MTTAAPLWKPTSPQSTRTAKFRDHVNAKFNLELESYEQLWRWSCDHRADFWSELWDFEGVVGTKGSHVGTGTAVGMETDTPGRR
jgi:acetoacetyl-CoA synthetase